MQPNERKLNNFLTLKNSPFLNKYKFQLKDDKLTLLHLDQVIKKISIEQDNKIKLILMGLISLLILQTFVHVGVNIRILPTTGMTLPFLSYGGSSIISNSILAGIILNLTRRKV